MLDENAGAEQRNELWELWVGKVAPDVGDQHPVETGKLSTG